MLFFLAMACGGSDDQTTPQAVSLYKGKSDLAALDKTSQLGFLNSFFGQFNSPLSKAISRSNPLDQKGVRFFLVESQAMLTKLSYEAIHNDSYFNPSLSGLFGGKVDYVLNKNGDSGEVKFFFEHFSLDGQITWNGNCTISYKEVLKVSKNIGSLKVQTSGLKLHTPSEDFIISGCLAQTFDPYFGSYQNDWNLHIEGSGLDLKLENYVEQGYRSFSGFSKAKITGQYYHHLYGRVDLDTLNTLEFQGQLPCYGGPFMIHGALNSSIKIIAEGFGLVHCELDQDGDRHYESIISLSHSTAEVY